MVLHRHSRSEQSIFTDSFASFLHPPHSLAVMVLIVLSRVHENVGYPTRLPCTSWSSCPVKERCVSISQSTEPCCRTSSDVFGSLDRAGCLLGCVHWDRSLLFAPLRVDSGTCGGFVLSQISCAAPPHASCVCGCSHWTCLVVHMVAEVRLSTEAVALHYRHVRC